MKNTKIFNALIVVLTIHIFSVHTKLLYYLNPEIGDKHSFSYLTLDEASILAMVFAISYSIATAFIIYLTNKKGMILTYAVLDGMSVLLYYFDQIPMYYSAFYFAFYTFFLIASAYYIRENKKGVGDIMKELKSNGLSQKDIAKQFNISESAVSRKLKES